MNLKRKFWYLLPNILRQIRSIRSWKDFFDFTIKLSFYLRSITQSRLLGNILISRHHRIAGLRYRFNSSAPLVTVLVPNFNHSQFLAERLDSIYSQSYRNFEVILLDDNSTDDSLVILRKYAELHKSNTRLFANSENSGSGYRQWMKGLTYAEGELIWIAESDDISESNFLEVMVSHFKNSAVRLAFSNSVFFEESLNNRIWDLASYWSSRSVLSVEKNWLISDIEFLENGMLKSNLIPNVSSVLFRKPSEFAVENSLKGLRFCGDWLFYIYQISGGLIAFESSVNNYYRVHANSTIKKNSNTIEFKSEFEWVRDQIALLASRPRILFALPGFVVGGGELFPFRMAQICERHGIIGSILITNQIPPTAREFYLFKNHLALYEPGDVRLFIKFANQNWNLIYSHHASVDLLCATYRGRDLKHLVSLHGMYEEIDRINLEKAEEILTDKKAIFTYTTDKNISAFSANFVAENTFIKVRNFIPEEAIPITTPPVIKTGQQLNACLIARAINGKGWIEAILAVEMFREENDIDLHLHLFGSGPIYQEVVDKYEFDWLHIELLANESMKTAVGMHLGLFLSTYPGESMPLILMEYLAIGLPTIFSKIGLSEEIMTDEFGPLGIALQKIDNKIDIRDISEALFIITNMSEQEQIELRKGMNRKFEQFSEAKNMNHYKNIFFDVISGDKYEA
jgi:glycosyltransferase involved in cell wall biosynthesis